MSIDPWSLSVHIAPLREYKLWKACPLVQSRLAGMFMFLVDVFV